jgi:formylglycine-generating enzyme required for sulfatase activity
LVKPIIATLIGGTLVGIFLLWIEYRYFIPAFENLSVPASSSCSFNKAFRDYLQDGGFGPEMVLIPAGQFKMGNVQEEVNLNEEVDANQQLMIYIESFAIGRYEITFAEYDRFAIATGVKKPDDQGWGRGNRPVINVSLEEATAYAEWLNVQQTNRQYRLPTEAEWEYAARAKTNSQYWWGDEIGLNHANCDSCGSRWDNKRTAPVGSFAANPFSLHDMLGNVYEWTCSEYEEKYTGKEQHCLSKHNIDSLRVLRGGSWYSLPRYVRVYAHFKNKLNYRDSTVGFRLVSTSSHPIKK